ncbi:MAG: radical SAM protein [Anaerolineales bacterium]|nr:radical SAM protein [Anaerolineales bacterium]
MSINELISKFKIKLKPLDDRISPGLYHYFHQENQGQSHIHLRISPQGDATLLINANQVLHLNPTAAIMAFLALEKTPQDKAVEKLTNNYEISEEIAEHDYAQFLSQFQLLINPESACPICDLDLDIKPPFNSIPSAPYRMDLALTYRCNNDCSHCYNARPRDFPELNTNQWIHILDLLWEIGIPHVVFTGGEPTLRSDLPELISHAVKNGQIVGLNTNGRRLSDKKFLELLVDAGLDHVQITVESHSADIHNLMVKASTAWKQTILGLQNALDTPLYVMTNTTLLKQNSPYLRNTLNFLTELGVPTIGLNALIYSGRGVSSGAGLSENELAPLLDLARSHTDANGQRLIWYTPTEYCRFDPEQLELGVKACTAALYNMCIEPDGGVIPCQSYYQTVGNIMHQPWESIWNHQLCLKLRQRDYIQSKCHGCSLLKECGGGCPLAIEYQEA